jgi:hypothetical protein
MNTGQLEENPEVHHYVHDAAAQKSTTIGTIVRGDVADVSIVFRCPAMERVKQLHIVTDISAPQLVGCTLGDNTFRVSS